MPTQLIGVRRVFGSAPGTAASAAAEAARWTSASGSSCSSDSVDHGSGSLTVIASAMKATAQPIADGARGDAALRRILRDATEQRVAEEPGEQRAQGRVHPLAAALHVPPLLVEPVDLVDPERHDAHQQQLGGADAEPRRGQRRRGPASDAATGPGVGPDARLRPAIRRGPAGARRPPSSVRGRARGGSRSRGPSSRPAWIPGRARGRGPRRGRRAPTVPSAIHRW